MSGIAGRSVISILLGEWPMWILTGLSILAVTLIIERALYFGRNRFDPVKGFDRFRSLCKKRDWEAAFRFARSEANPMGRLFALLLNNMSMTADELSSLAYSAVLEEKLLFERFLGGIGTMANAATLVGLLGTVWGLIIAFNKVYTAAGAGGAKVVAGGIAVALLATLVGLFVGILSLVFFNYFNKKASDLTNALESLMEKSVVVVVRAQADSEPVSSTGPESRAEAVRVLGRASD